MASMMEMEPLVKELRCSSSTTAVFSTDASQCADLPDGYAEGRSAASSLSHRWLHPGPLLHVAVVNPSDQERVGKAPLQTGSDAAYSAFLSAQPLPRPLHRIPPAIFDTGVPWALQWPMFFGPYTADAHVQRATALLYLTLCIIGIVWRNSPWLWYVVSGMCADAGMRAFGGDRLAVLSTLVEMITTFIPGTYTIAFAPRQFAWMVYTALLLASVMVTGYIINGDSNHVALATLLGVQAGLYCLEVLGISLPGLLFERVLVPWGAVRDTYVHKAEATVALGQLKMASAKAKMQHSGASHTIVVSRADGSALMRFDGLTLGARTKFDPIRNCSIGYCFPLLGVAGLASLFYYCNTLAGVSKWAWQVLAVLLGALYLVFWSVQVVRCFLVPAMVLRELQHPHLRYSFMLILGVPLLSIDFMIDVSLTYCKVILWACAPLVLCAVLVFLRDFVLQPMQFEVLNASWLISVIVMIVAAFEVPQVYPDLSELAWLWLAFGLFLWAMFVGLVLVRLFFTPPLPDSQRATLFLLMSTAAIATAAVIFQNPQASIYFIGPYSTLAEWLHWLTTFIGMFCYWLLLNAYFCRLPFNMTAWAISFPSSALALVWIFYWQIGNCDQLSPTTQASSEERCTNNQDSDTVRGIVILLVVNAVVGNTVLGVNTVLAIIQRRLFLPMPIWSPASIIQLHHFAFRTALYRADHVLSTVDERGRAAPNGIGENHSPPPAKPMPRWHHRLSQRPLGLSATCPCSACVAQGPPSTAELLQDCMDLLVMLDLSFSVYLRIKRELLWPSLRQWLPHVQLEHVQNGVAVDLRPQLYPIMAVVAQLQAAHATGSPSEAVSRSIADLHARIAAVGRVLHSHLDHEETLLTPLTLHFSDLPSANAFMRAAWQLIDYDTKRVVLPWVLNTLPDHPQRMAFIDCLAWSTDESLTLLGRWLADSVDPFLYKTLCVDYPRLKRRAASPYSKFW